MQKDNGRRLTLTAVQADYNSLSGNLAGTPGLTTFTQILMRKQCGRTFAYTKSEAATLTARWALTQCKVIVPKVAWGQQPLCHFVTPYRAPQG